MAPFRQDEVTEFEAVEGDETDDSVTVVVSLPGGLAAWLDERAGAAEMSVSELVELALLAQVPDDVDVWTLKSTIDGP
ncbi:hypothetical protein UG55_108236 [Frankia sp. EI5c]|nr:hypothetical protein UG55_108236 [Frankia sp. EI5c]